MRSVFGAQTEAELQRILADDRINSKRPIAEWDAAPLLRVLWDEWNTVFRRTLGQAERSLVSELRQHRHNWAHQGNVTGEDAYRMFDSAGRLLAAISAPQSDEIEKAKLELLRLRFDEQVRGEKRKVAGNAIESSSGLKPWRDVVTPHRDVASGGEALKRLRNVVGRVEATWRPASAEEGFEIVRRRLFEPIISNEQHKDRDVVARAFSDFYRDQQSEFPPECQRKQRPIPRLA